MIITTPYPKTTVINVQNEEYIRLDVNIWYKTENYGKSYQLVSLPEAINLEKTYGTEL